MRRMVVQRLGRFTVSQRPSHVGSLAATEKVCCSGSRARFGGGLGRVFPRVDLGLPTLLIGRFGSLGGVGWVLASVREIVFGWLP